MARDAIQQIKDDLIYLIHESEAAIGLSSNYDADPMPSTNTPDYEYKMFGAIGSIKRTNRLTAKFSKCTLQSQKILCAWVASQDVSLHIKLYFGELSWIAVYLFDAQYQRLHNICSHHQLQSTQATKLVIDQLKQQSVKELNNAILEFANAT